MKQTASVPYKTKRQNEWTFDPRTKVLLLIELDIKEKNGEYLVCYCKIQDAAFTTEMTENKIKIGKTLRTSATAK